MFLSVLLLASLDKGTLFVEHPEVSMKVPAIFGKPATPTPPGIYLVTRGYSKQLDLKLLIFMRQDGSTWAVHPNLKSRTKQIKSESTADNYLSGGCIGIEQEAFDKLWSVKQTMVLQVY